MPRCLGGAAAQLEELQEQGPAHPPRRHRARAAAHVHHVLRPLERGGLGPGQGQQHGLLRLQQAGRGPARHAVEHLPGARRRQPGRGGRAEALLEGLAGHAALLLLLRAHVLLAPARALQPRPRGGRRLGLRRRRPGHLRDGGPREEDPERRRQRRAAPDALQGPHAPRGRRLRRRGLRGAAQVRGGHRLRRRPPPAAHLRAREAQHAPGPEPRRAPAHDDRHRLQRGVAHGHGHQPQQARRAAHGAQGRHRQAGGDRQRAEEAQEEEGGPRQDAARAVLPGPRPALHPAGEGPRGRQRHGRLRAGADGGLRAPRQARQAHPGAGGLRLAGGAPGALGAGSRGLLRPLHAGGHDARRADDAALLQRLRVLPLRRGAVPLAAVHDLPRGLRDGRRHGGPPARELRGRADLPRAGEVLPRAEPAPRAAALPHPLRGALGPPGPPAPGGAGLGAAAPGAGGGAQAAPRGLAGNEPRGGAGRQGGGGALHAAHPRPRGRGRRALHGDLRRARAGGPRAAARGHRGGPRPGGAGPGPGLPAPRLRAAPGPPGPRRGLRRGRHALQRLRGQGLPAAGVRGQARGRRARGPHRGLPHGLRGQSAPPGAGLQARGHGQRGRRGPHPVQRQGLGREAQGAPLGEAPGGRRQGRRSFRMSPRG
mmetsp:Transcript_11315/g.35058  ORF Transcript_11315/g.35058 Transcript_11315/m.35058 type:complete len:653 (-) Transcript_11315:77-2035(-)